MPGPRVPKHFPRGGPVRLDLDEQPLRVGHTNRGVPRNVTDLPDHQEQPRSPSHADSYAPLFDNDNDMDVSGAEDDEDDEDDDEGAIDQNAMLRARLADLMIDSRDYDALPAGFDEDQLRLNLEYTERDFDQEPDTIPFDEDFIDKNIVGA
ncbi:hypothetical protein QBC45DRAFT_446657 [Copromyces sp. CBS 386.78]|nr:hypothetical protein QBC45DRAFT_446657 [Copromyces sp. CBS 386.78]